MDELHALADAAVAVVARGPRRLTLLQRYSIVALRNDGRKPPYIARHLKCNVKTVRAVLRRFRDTGIPGSGSRSGRPRATTADEDLEIAVTARVERFTSPRRVKRQLQLDVSPRTIDRRMQEAGLFGRVARHKRDYTEAQIRTRLSFAHGYADKDVDWWSKVLFSDEKIFWGKGFCGRAWVRREKGTALEPVNCVNKTAHPVKVNVWACFAAGGQGYIHIFNENLDAALMKRILAANLLPSAELHFSFDPPEQWYFLHDNDKKFKSHLVQNFIHDKGITTIDFPPYSPDLNPIENLWATLAREVEKKQCDTMEELQDEIERVWNEADKEHMRNLVASMPARCAAVIAAKGWHTDY